jgi:branched-subunit amino acid ABC-type transport system permease component
MSLTGALLGFFVPLIPFIDDGIRGSAFWAGILGTLGAIGGMSLAEYCLGWIENAQ